MVCSFSDVVFVGIHLKCVGLEEGGREKEKRKKKKKKKRKKRKKKEIEKRKMKINEENND